MLHFRLIVATQVEQGLATAWEIWLISMLACHTFGKIKRMSGYILPNPSLRHAYCNNKQRVIVKQDTPKDRGIVVLVCAFC